MSLPDIINILNTFYRVAKVPLSLYNEQYESVFCLPFSEYSLWPSKNIKNLHKKMLDLGFTNTIPFMFSDQFEIHTGVLCLPSGYLLIIGPISSSPIDVDMVSLEYADSIPVEARDSFAHAYRTSIPADTARFANILSLAVQLFYQVYTSPVNILTKNYTIDESTEESMNPDNDIPLLAEQNILPNDILLFEKNLFHNIALGNQTALNETLSTLHPIFQKIPVESALAEPYITLPVYTIIRYAALNGGADAEKVFALYNKHAGSIPKLNSSGEHLSSIIIFAKECCSLVIEANYSYAYQDTKRRIEGYINRHLNENITKPILAKHCSVSERQISRVFEECFHMTMSDYIHRERIHQACVLLTASNYTASEISTRLGYVSQSHFTKYFKKFIGTTPKEYRRNPYNSTSDLNYKSPSS